MGYGDGMGLYELASANAIVSTDPMGEASWRPFVTFNYTSPGGVTTIGTGGRLSVGRAQAHLQWECSKDGSVVNFTSSDVSVVKEGIQRPVQNLSFLWAGVLRAPTYGPTVLFQEKEADCCGKKGVLVQVNYTVADARPSFSGPIAPKGIGGVVTFPEGKDWIIWHVWYKICCCCSGEPTSTQVTLQTPLFKQSSPRTRFSVGVTTAQVAYQSGACVPNN